MTTSFRRLPSWQHITLVAAVSLLALATAGRWNTPVTTAPAVDPLVFVSRQIPQNGSIYLTSARDMPGVGARSRFRVAAPGRLLVRDSNGSGRTLIDGRRPSTATLNLIDVNAPDVSYDGKRIVFAGLPAGDYPTGPNVDPNAWRLFVINADGTGLAQITQSDQELDLSQFGTAAIGLQAYDDTDPAWLPDGRIVFTSTRWPSFGHYSGVRTTNLYVVNVDGSSLHRITAERNGADRPQVDPLTGKIVFSRWWRNHRFALDDERTVLREGGGYVQKDGLSANRDVQMSGRPEFANYLWRNVWNPASINPDGTELKAWGGSFLQEGDGSSNHVYGGAFAPDGAFYANFFPMFNMTEAAGFGGIRRFTPGPASYQPIIGITGLQTTYLKNDEPKSYGIYPGPYAAEPAVMSDGALLISLAADTNQDYGLYRVNADGTGLERVYDLPGTSELRARSLAPRHVPPVLTDRVALEASPLPPPANGPFDADGTFTFDALNVYANAPVDTDIVSAPAVGSASRIRFFIDHQRTSPGSYPHLDWPVLLEERSVSATGAVRTERAPANVPLFEQLRSADSRVPLTHGPDGNLGAAHVAGLNFGRPGAVVRCVGCHIGHSMMPVPEQDADAAWTNLAPGATVTASSSRNANVIAGINDRRALKAEPSQVWSSEPGASRSSQWVRLTFPVPVTVRTVRLYAPVRSAQSDLVIRESRVILLDDRGGQVASGYSGEVKAAGTDLTFDNVTARSVRIEFRQLTGSFMNGSVAALAEVEVIARGAGN
ncbi:MAG: hypothetical protein U0Q11_03835 [Vicinamibacterales bacterium]|mgnify:CR=1 FL=1